MEDLKYPIGKFEPKDFYTAEEISLNIKKIEAAPALLEQAVKNLTDAQLDTPYREAGWTVRQVVHHIADSHLNAYLRVKWTLTESSPLIKAYDEKLWAETPETKLSIDISQQLLISLHIKWTTLLRQLKPEDMGRYFVHPETKKNVRIDRMIATYAWHGDHHRAHILKLKDRMGW